MEFHSLQGAEPDPSEVAGDLAQGEAVTLSTPDEGQVGTALPVDNGHDYACLAYDPSNGKFLFYNPWGTANCTTVTSTISAYTLGPEWRRYNLCGRWYRHRVGRHPRHRLREHAGDPRCSGKQDGDGGTRL